MKQFKRYNVWIACLFVPTICVLPLVSSLMQPYYGDLTRVGGWREQEFGWNKPVRKFKEPLYTIEEAGSHTNSDVVVFGDSFSMQRDQSWPNYFVNATGLSLSVYPVRFYPFEQHVKNTVFQEYPPKIVIYESAERNLATLLDKESKNCQAAPPVNVPVRPQAPRGVSTELVGPPRSSGVLNYALAFDYVSKAFPRFLGINVTRTVKLKLNKRGLFSSNNDAEILVYRGDIRQKRRWTENTPANIRCKLLEYQNMVQANGKTLFVAMIPPDKLTAYSAYLSNKELAGLSRLQEIVNAEGLNLARIDKRLIAAIHEGVIDVYLPNDTHWGSAGHSIVADELERFLATYSETIHPKMLATAKPAAIGP